MGCSAGVSWRRAPATRCVRPHAATPGGSVPATQVFARPHPVGCIETRIGRDATDPPVADERRGAMSTVPGSDATPIDDPQGLGRRLASDPGALQDCYAALSPMVLAYLRRFVPRDEAEDVLQQVFLDVWRSRDRFDPSRRLEPWVLNIAHRRAVDHLRRMSRSPADPAIELPADVADGDLGAARFADR